MEILPKLTRFRINGLEISSFYTLDNVLDKEKENIFQTPQGTVQGGRIPRLKIVIVLVKCQSHQLSPF